VNTSEIINKPKWTLWQAVSISVIAYLLSLLAASFVSIRLEDFKIDDTAKNFIVYASNTAVLLAVALLFIKRRHVQWKDFFQFPKKKALLWIPVYFGVYLFASTIVQSILQLLPNYDASQNQDVGFSTVSGSSLALVFIALVVLPPLGEEVIFRGILYTGLKSRLRKTTAALIASVLFGLAHAQWNVGADTFVLSLVAIYAYEKHKTLWLPISLHALKNFIAFLALFVFKM
jgi:membrane protease YdiL (CAAX protease family)